MSIKRSKLWLALGLPLFFASMAWGQELPDNEWVPGVRDFQPFAPASSTTSPYGSGPKRSRGWFFTIEDLAWSTNNPRRTTIGAEGYNPLVSTGVPGGFINQPNSLDSGFIQPTLTQGERLQLGYVGEDGVGLLIGTFVVHTSSSSGFVSNGGVSFTSNFVNGVSPLEGFLEEALVVPPNQPGLTAGSTVVVDADLNHNGVFGGSGRDIGTPNPTPPPTFVPPPDGFPDVPAPTDFGDLVQLPIFFTQIVTKYSSNIWGTEVMRTWWLSKHRQANKGYWDVMAGARFIRFRDSFYFDGEGAESTLAAGGTGSGGSTGTGTPKVIEGLLSNTNISQQAANYLVGPQVGLRWYKQRGRLGWNIEGRFSAAANFQTSQQAGNYAQRPESGKIEPTFVVFNPQPSSAFLSSLNGGTGTTTAGAFTVPQFRDPFLVSQGFHSTYHATTFSPIGELRVNATYQIFRNVQATVGWTGLVMGGIARSINMVNYNIPGMGIITNHNQQAVFINGINFGLTWNR
jgi:hypothetical protein